jgi:hypothetical protein
MLKFFLNVKILSAKVKIQMPAKICRRLIVSKGIDKVSRALSGMVLDMGHEDLSPGRLRHFGVDPVAPLQTFASRASPESLARLYCLPRSIQTGLRTVFIVLNEPQKNTLATIQKIGRTTKTVGALITISPRCTGYETLQSTGLSYQGGIWATLTMGGVLCSTPS